jgi:hypothetical protein
MPLNFSKKTRKAEPALTLLISFVRYGLLSCAPRGTDNFAWSRV